MEPLADKPHREENTIFIKVEPNLLLENELHDDTVVSSVMKVPEVKLESKYDVHEIGKQPNGNDILVQESKCDVLSKCPQGGDLHIDFKGETQVMEMENNMDSKCAFCNMDIPSKPKEMSFVNRFCRDCHTKRNRPDFQAFITNKYGSCDVCLNAVNNNMKSVKHDCTRFDVYICEYCNAVFYDKTLIKRHMENRFNKYSCSKCGVQYCDEKRIGDHKRCDTGGDSAISSSTLEFSLRNEAQSFTGEGSKVPRIRRKPRWSRRNGEPQSLCNVCMKYLPSDKSLKKHMLVHFPKESIIQCHRCKKEFCTIRELNLHRSDHKDDKAGNGGEDNLNGYTCHLCGRCFLQHDQLTRHINIHESKKIKCQFCDKLFSRTGDLTRHLDTHENMRKYKCHLCEKSFNNKHVLTQHIAGHENKKRFKCHLCDKSYNHNSPLYRHIAAHENKREYKCPLCVWSFNHKTSLKQHMDSHENKRKFKCHLCDWDFNHLSALRQHVEAHGAESK